MSSNKRPDGDERFLRVQKDPRFWEMPERERKVKIDKRFRSMFHDERFKVKYTVDKRGRPIDHTSAEDLRRFYKMSDSEEEEEEAGEGEKAAEEKKKKDAGGAEAEQPEGAASLSEGDEEDDEQRSAEEDEDEASGSDEEESGLDSGDDGDSEPDLARGRGNVETSSDEDDEDDVDAVLRKEEEEIEHDWGELCKDAPRSDQVSARLAVCNADWDRLKARDLLALLQSFTPQGGAVLAVKIYPSEFGKERLKAEESRGPAELKALPDDSEDDTEEERVYREKLRDYQFKRLKYFYAVAECDSAQTAAKIYEECNGYEYESSCSVLDLRFVPDDVTFDEEPEDAATDVNLSAYAPKLFTSSAATTSKVQLTWDETDHERVTALNRKFNKDELLDMDFRAYLASSSEEEEEEEGGGDGAFEEDVKTEADERVVEAEQKKKSEEQISKYRELLRGIQEREKKVDKDMEMEVTWVPGLKETTEQLVKKKLEAKDVLTPWEEFLQKKREKKKQKKCESKQGAGEGGEGALCDDELPSDVDLSDPFFSEELGAADMKKKQKGKKKKKQEEERRTAEEEEELQRQKAQMALLMDDDDKHFNYDEIVEQQNLSKRKRKKLLKKGAELPQDDAFQVDVKDPRFQAMFTSHLFNLDPSHPGYKKTKATQSIVAEKQRRREEERRRLEVTPTRAECDARAPAKQTDPSLALLVRSIKSKTQQFQARKKQKLL